MIHNRLPEFNQVSAGKTSQLRIPAYQLTLKRMQLRFGGTLMNAGLINEIRLKLGTSTRWSASGAQLLGINGYKAIAAGALFLPLDFSERDFRSILGEEIGGWDLALLNDPLYLEVDIGAGASAPTMYANAWFTPPQIDPNKKDQGQLVQKYVRATFQANAIGNTRNQLPFDPKGALIKRVFLTYTGTDHTPSADGNLNKLEVKKNGGVVWEQTCLDARESQFEYDKVPQSKTYVADFTLDNNLSGALKTADAQALEFNAFLTAADQITAIFDVLDKPYNL